MALNRIAVIVLIQIGVLACSDDSGTDCGPNPCGACQPGCTHIDKCTSSGWQCTCSCPDGGALDGGEAKPGACFEVFATLGDAWKGTPLGGISHSLPRKDDLGQVALGDTVKVTVRFFNFCNDQQSVVVGTKFLQPDAAFTIAQQPTAGAKLGTNELVVVEYKPAQIGKDQTAIRFEVTHGYYDFTLTGEGVAP